jgi:hypothetical protein
MSDNKKHHYVPRFYLKRFSQDKKSIGVFNIHSGLIVENANLKNQCYKNYFYGKEKEFESAIDGIEGEASKLLRMIDEIGILPPPLSGEHLVLIFYVLLQYSRTKYAADALNEMHDKMTKHIFRDKIERETGVNLDNYLIGIQNISQYSVGLSIQAYPVLIDLAYKILLNKTEIDFITSDNPIVMINPFLSFIQFGSNTGFANKGLLIFFPIATDQVILFYDPMVYRVGNDSKIALKLDNFRDIENINILQGCSCYDNVYFKKNNFGSFAFRKKVIPFRRMKKSNIRVFPELNDSSQGSKRTEIMMGFKEDIQYNPKLSFLGIRKSAKEWRKRTTKSKILSGAFIRNPDLLKEYKVFRELVEQGKYSVHQFFLYLKETDSGNLSLPLEVK